MSDLTVLGGVLKRLIERSRSDGGPSVMTNGLVTDAVLILDGHVDLTHEEGVAVFRLLGRTATPEERAAEAEALAKSHERLSEAVEDWAKQDDELGWPGDPILQDPGNCDDLAAFLQERGLA